MSEVEVLKVIDAATTKTTIDALSFSGLQTLKVDGSTGAELQIDNLGNIVALELTSNLGSGDVVDVNYSAAATIGSADSQSITTDSSAATVELAGIESTSITTSGTASTIILTDASATDVLATVTVAGSGSYSHWYWFYGRYDRECRFNTGDLTLDVSAAGRLTVAGGSGDDTFTIGTIVAADTVVGGAGTDALVTAAAVTAANAAGVSGIEPYRSSALAVRSQVASAFSVDTFVIGANNNNVTLSALTDEAVSMTATTTGINTLTLR